MSVISSDLTRTMTGWAEVTRVLSGMVDTGLSLALKPGRSAYRVVSLSRCCLMPCTRVMRVQIKMLCSLRELATTMAVELRMTAITGVLELRSGLNPNGQLVVSLLKVVIKAIIEFLCVQYVEKYNVSIGSWATTLVSHETVTRV